MPDLTPPVTADELARMSARDDYRYELDAGRVIRMSPVGWQHGVIVARLLGLLVPTCAGGTSVAVTEVGFKLQTNPDTVRGQTSPLCVRNGCRAPRCAASGAVRPISQWKSCRQTTLTEKWTPRSVSISQPACQRLW